MDGAFYSRVPPLSPLSLPPLSQGPNTGRPVEELLSFRSPPSSAPFGGTCPYPLCRCATSPLDKGSRPPWRGKACGRLTAAPTADIEAAPFSRRGRSQTGPTAYLPGALVRETQAQVWNRTSGNFCKPRAQRPGRKRKSPLRFCAPEILQNLTSTRPP